MYINSLNVSCGVEKSGNKIFSCFYKEKPEPVSKKKTEIAREYRDYSDIELIDLYAKNRDENAFNEIYKRYYKIVLGTVFKSFNDSYKAEDVTQEVFIKLLNNAGKFRRESKFSTWLFAITYNTIKMKYRAMSKQRKTVSVDDDDSNIAESEISDSNTTINDAENFVISREIAEKLNDALEQIPYKSREVFLLREKKGYTNPEIATELDISLHAVKARLFRTRVQIKEKLNNLNPY